MSGLIASLRASRTSRPVSHIARLFELEFQSAELPQDFSARPVVARLPIDELLEPDTGPVALGSDDSVPVVVDAELPESPPPPHAERRVSAPRVNVRPAAAVVIRFIFPPPT